MNNIVEGQGSMNLNQAAHDQDESGSCSSGNMSQSFSSENNQISSIQQVHASTHGSQNQ